jgi:hypothetical protein
MFVEQHKSKIKFFRKHYGTFKTFIAAVLLFIGIVPRLLIWSFLALAGRVANTPQKEHFLLKRGNYVAAFAWYLKSGFVLAIAKKR